jgi:hypothetical protein
VNPSEETRQELMPLLPLPQPLVEFAGTTPPTPNQVVDMAALEKLTEQTRDTVNIDVSRNSRGGVRLTFSRPVDHININDQRVARRLAEMIRIASHQPRWAHLADKKRRRK